MYNFGLCFAKNVVAMATHPLLLKNSEFRIAYLNSRTPKTLPYMQNSIFCTQMKLCLF